ncbi:MAG: biotin/lipoyl-containing protein [Dehalococcoidia bacterium]
MATTVTIPTLGAGARPAHLAEWYLDDGSPVQRGQPLYRLEADYVSIDVEAEASGILRRRLAAGSAERPGEVVAVLLAPGEQPPADWDDRPRPALASRLTAVTPPAQPAATSKAPIPLRRPESEAPIAPVTPLPSVFSPATAERVHFAGDWSVREPQPAPAVAQAAPPPLAPAAEPVAPEASAAPAKPTPLAPIARPTLAAPPASLFAAPMAPITPVAPALALTPVLAPAAQPAPVALAAETVAPASEDVKPVDPPQAAPAATSASELAEPADADFEPGDTEDSLETLAGDDVSFEPTSLATLPEEEDDAEYEAEEDADEHEAEAFEDALDEDPAFDETEAEPELLADFEEVAAIVVPEASFAPSRAALPEPAPIWLRANLKMTEVQKLTVQLAREWRTAGVTPSVEDVVLRAAARAAAESAAFDPPVAALVAVVESFETLAFLEGAGRGPFRDQVTALKASRQADEIPGTAFVLTSLASYGVEEGSSPLGDGHAFALTLGATVERPAGGLTTEPMATLTVTYHPDMLSVGEAATILNRIRELIEAPYALLAD